MIDLYYAPTPNGVKITIFLEESGLDYQLHTVNILADEQFRPSFLKISPNNRIPAIVDHAPNDGQGPISVFESGAILQYLADKTGKFWPKDLRGRTAVNEWLFWQMAGLGPMTGQANHFTRTAPEKIPYAMERYINEVRRLYGVMDRRLENHAYLGGNDYSIADMAAWPWVLAHWYPIDGFDHLIRWHKLVGGRPAVQKASQQSRDMYAAGVLKAPAPK